MSSDCHEQKNEPVDVSRPGDSDEISLVEVWLVLVRHKWTIIGIFLFVLGVGSVYAFIRSPNYMYSTSVEIGTTLVDTKGAGLQPQLIEPPAAVQAKLESSYVPIVLNKFRDEKPSNFLPDIEIKVPKDSQIVILRSRGKVGDEEIVKNLHQQVVQELITDHKRQLRFPREQLDGALAQEQLKLNALENQQIFAVQLKAQQGKIEQAKLALANLKDQARALTAEKQGLTEKKKLYEKQIKELSEFLAKATSRKPSAEKEVADEAAALTFLMVNNQLENTRARLADVEEKLLVDLKYKVEEVENKFRENQRQQKDRTRVIDELQSVLVKLKLEHTQAQDAQKQVLKDLRGRIATLQITRDLGTIRSLKPVGAGRVVVVAVAGLLGVFLGFFVALFSEFLLKVKEQQTLA